MQKISMRKIANNFTSGYSQSHSTSKHKPEECIIWQQAINEFSEWIDGSYSLYEKSQTRITQFYKYSKFNPIKWIWCLYCETKHQINNYLKQERRI